MRKDWIEMKELQTILCYKSPTKCYEFLRRYNIRVTKPVGKPLYNLEDIREVLDGRAVRMGV
jgi:hypothetical protein